MVAGSGHPAVLSDPGSDAAGGGQLPNYDRSVNMRGHYQNLKNGLILLKTYISLLCFFSSAVYL